MARRFQSGQAITFPVPAAMQVDGGPLTLLVVAKVNTSAYHPIVYSRSSGAHGWWMEYDTSGGLHQNYGTGTTPRNVGTVATGAWRIDVGSKDNGGTSHPFGRHFTGSSFATDSGDVDSGLTLVDGTAVDATWGIAFGRWGNTGTDYAADLEIAFFAAWVSFVAGSTLAGLTKTKAGIIAGSPTYWASFEGTTMTDSAGGTAVLTGSPTSTTDPTGFFSSGFSAALPVASRTTPAQTLVGLKARALPAASRTAPAVTLAGRKVRALPPAARTTAALATAGKKTRALPAATRLAVAVAAVGQKTRALPVATRTASVPATAGKKTRALPAAVRTAATVPTAGAKWALLPVAVRTAVAGAMANGGIMQSLPVAIRTAVAGALTGFKRRELPPATRYSTAVTLAGGEEEGDRVMDLGAIMDEMARKLRLAPSLAGRTFAYPPASIKAPAAIVTYPEDYTFDATYGRGMDRMTGEVVVAVGRPHERQSRDLLTKYVNGSGPESVKALLDGGQGSYTSCDSVRVAKAVFDVVVIGGVDYLAAVFSVDIAGRGAS